MSLPCSPIWTNSNNPRRQQGVVIVIALLIVAIVASLAYIMVGRLSRDTRRTTLLLHDVQAYFYAQGAVAWAQDQLRLDWQRQKPDQIVDAMPVKSPINEEDGYRITSTIYDMQGRFNLNNLGSNDAQTDFQRLVKYLQPKMPSDQVDSFIKALIDWLRPGQGQAELTQYYAGLEHPYRASHRPMISVSELRLVKGMTPSLYLALSPYVTALPIVSLINVQTADVPVLLLLSPSMTPAAAKAIIEQRKQTPMTDVNKFANIDVVKNNKISTNKVTVISNYFLLETEVSIGDQHAVFYTLLERITHDKQAIVNVVWQSRGTW
jgi:general secretion pathway protein K